MLLIRASQYEVLAAYTKRQFVRHMQHHLRSIFPQQTERMADPDLQALIERTISALREFNILRECDVERFLYLMFTFSFNIATDPHYAWVQDILFNENLSGQIKVDLLYERGEHRLNDGTQRAT